jgi:Uma2 family endonuclease
VLSPHPRIGQLDERVEWFSQYGVRECWLLRQEERRLEILTLVKGRVGAREVFDEGRPIESPVLPAFRATLRSLLR